MGFYLNKVFFMSLFRKVLFKIMSGRGGGRGRAGFPQRVVDYVKSNATKGDVDGILKTIDHYCATVESGMHVGDKKGAVMDSIVKEKAPKVALELGAFFGYSAIRTAHCMTAGTKLYTVENDPANAKVTSELVDFADANDKITVVENSSSTALQEFKTNFNVDSFDFVFIDHWKDLYLTDFKLIESLGLIQSGSVCLADNCTFPGCPDFLEYVRNNPKYETKNFDCGWDSMEKVTVK